MDASRSIRSEFKCICYIGVHAVVEPYSLEYEERSHSEPLGRKNVADHAGVEAV